MTFYTKACSRLSFVSRYSFCMHASGYLTDFRGSLFRCRPSTEARYS